MTSASSEKVVAILPARWASTRLPGKPLIDIQGLPLIERVRRQVLKCRLVNEVLVATDDQRILSTVNGFGGQAVLTRTDHHSGTDRLAEVVRRRDDITIAVNVQGDEPLIDPQAIDSAIEPLLNDLSLEMATIACPIKSDVVDNPNMVKVVINKDDYALYFSRAAIPFVRDQSDCPRLHHAGLYVYRRNCLLRLAALAPSNLELAESLEQLRALENGIAIKVIQTDYRPQEVNVAADVASVVAFLSSAQAFPL
jgi:3-deoxy-manno-octulosonate cytidylyltransferase (CMP-KDO synthetase)